MYHRDLNRHPVQFFLLCELRLLRALIHVVSLLLFLTYAPKASELALKNVDSYRLLTYTSSTFTRCSTLRTIPNICGVASTSFDELVLFKPNACKVSFCRSGLSIGLFTNVILIFFICFALLAMTATADCIFLSIK